MSVSWPRCKPPLFIPFQKSNGIRSHLQLNNLMFYICRIYKKGLMIKNLSETAFHDVCKASLNMINHRIKRFYKGVWGSPLPHHLLTECFCGCFDLQYAGVKFKRLQTHNAFWRSISTPVKHYTCNWDLSSVVILYYNRLSGTFLRLDTGVQTCKQTLMCKNSSVPL